MHPKNSTASSMAQECNGEQPDMAPQPESKMPEFSSEQRNFVVGLLKAERAHASRWWTFLNELRLYGQLPEWVGLQVVGTEQDYDRWNADCLTTNRELLGISYHLNGFAEDSLIDRSMGTWLCDVDGSAVVAPQNAQSENVARGAGGQA